MWAIYLIVLVLVLTSVRYSAFHEDYLMPKRCNAIKGIFILFVFVRHLRSYLLDIGAQIGRLDTISLFIDDNLGQLIVAMFLFYSGYGLMESYKKKGAEYINLLPSKRILPTLLNFDIAVLIFYVVSLAIGKNYSTQELCLSLIGWESVGNSNWYIFVILICYILFYLSNSIFGREKNPQSIILLLCFLFFTGAMLSKTKPEWWYNTLLCFLSGIFYSNYVKGYEEKLLKVYWAVFLTLIIIIVILFIIESDFYCIKYNVLSTVFAFWVILLTMKFQIRSDVLCWLGKNLFPMYIFQRLPMIVLASYDGVFWVSNTVAFSFVTLFFTVGLTFLYKYIDVNNFINSKRIVVK